MTKHPSVSGLKSVQDMASNLKIYLRKLERYTDANN